ncbi:MULTISPECIES: hypothetical protein [Catenuloplanes]|uniref:Uncharacterized protein n=1 Tax=Catenuloplanes niger TaxID=587534 RepID=A0AAE3ZZC3_9ACTN|nr:hypothetical protein [Catenuloplanes niger]MDR7326505.1 hypothetical protein [Catenuloplanes niger]
MRRLGCGATLVAVLLAGCGDTGEPAAPRPGTSAFGTSAPSAVPSPPPSVAGAAPRILMFTVEGDAEIISIVRELDGERTTEGPVSPPWRGTVEVPADGRPHRWSLTLTHGSGRAELVATLDGAVAGQTRGAGTGEGTLRVSGSVDG